MSNYSEARFTYAATSRSGTDAWTTHDLSRTDNDIHVENVDFRFSATSGATSFAWYLSLDANGEYAVTPVNTAASITSGKSGSVKVATAAVARSLGNDSRNNGLYLQFKIEQGSGTATFDVFCTGVRL
jgi:hypothetical protein